MGSNNKTILILGSTGFIGKNLFNHFQGPGRYQVLAPTRAQLDLLDDDACRMYLEENRPSYVIHAAVDIASVEKSIRMFMNIYNHRHYFDHMVQLGSGAEYDKRLPTTLISEDNFGRSVPIDSYGLAKYLIAREIQSDPKKVTNIRLFGIFGEHENYSRRFISNNICRVLAGLPISINKDMLFDYIDVRDLAGFIEYVLPMLPLSNQAYNFCSSNPISLSRLADIIKLQMGVSDDVKIRECGMNPEYSGSSSKLFSEISGFKFTDHEQSIARLTTFYRSTMDKDALETFRRAQEL